MKLALRPPGEVADEASIMSLSPPVPRSQPQRAGKPLPRPIRRLSCGEVAAVTLHRGQVGAERKAGVEQVPGGEAGPCLQAQRGPAFPCSLGLAASKSTLRLRSGPGRQESGTQSPKSLGEAPDTDTVFQE